MRELRLGGLLILCALAPAGSQLEEARKLLTSESPAERGKGFHMLLAEDHRFGVEVAEMTIERSLKRLDRLAGTLDKQDAEVSEAFSRVWYLEQIRESGTASHRYASSVLAAAEARLDLTLIDAYVDLLTISMGGIAMSSFKSEEALREIEKGARTDSNPTARTLFVDALGRPECRSSVPALLAVLRQTDLRFVSSAVRALVPHAAEAGVLDAVRPLLVHDHWALRLGAYRVFACAPKAEAIATLVAAIAREEGEIAFACDSYLEDLTGRSFAEEPARWAAWWQENEAAVRAGTYAPPEAQGGAGAEASGETRSVARFFRIPVESRRVVFAIDFSGSMTEEIALADARSTAIRARHGLPATRIGHAKAELIAAIEALPDGALFNIIAYNDVATPFQSRLVRAGKTMRQSAVQWILAREAQYMTNLWDALRQSFRDYLDSRGGNLRFPELPDTIFFLTDGNATRGRFRKSDSLLRCFEFWNGPVEVVVHCIGIGEDQDRVLLQGMAQATGGYYLDPQKGADALARRRRLPAREPAGEPEPPK